MSKKWRDFLVRVVIGVVVALIIMFAPLPWFTPRWFTYFQVPAGVFLLVCYMGVLIYDTLFFDQYRH